MSTASEITDEEKSFVEEQEEKINIGLYIGGRNSKSERNGRGWAILPNGDQYDGQYRKGQRHGIGLYVFKDGSRYFGQYRCGIRSGRGIFIYPDGSYYEGNWRKNLKHGKGRYSYANGDSYCGSWYRGQRHGVGIYTSKSLSSNAFYGAVSFTGTWRQGVRVGPFQLNFGSEDKYTTLHGTWDNLYPQGPCVFSFNNRYLLMGYFQTPGREAWLALQARKNRTSQLNDFMEETVAVEESDNNELDIWQYEPSIWCAQDMCAYDMSLLPQEPVPLPISDSDISVCSLSTEATEISIEKPFIYKGEEDEEIATEEGNLECGPCECSSSGVESYSQVCPSYGNPCAIEITPQKNC
ncbi:flagellar radial spoke protein 1 [Lucilia cuprina]|uniref:flagellar radial spoke protein 1 n=1 Tax=Lucilia cuprina TaxID=7375 RepID=UPI001F063BA8|nr:flagellar radial spoke protein 1 [Lucilia cuprina]